MPRRIVLTKAGGPNTLAVIPMDMPEPKAGEIPN
jgi:NADPH:quinone reductase-like Zn-dependent oxidoreductase